MILKDRSYLGEFWKCWEGGEEGLRKGLTFFSSFSHVCPPFRALLFTPFFLFPLPSFALPCSPHLAERRNYLVGRPVSAGRVVHFSTFVPYTLYVFSPNLFLFNFLLAYFDTADSTAGVWRVKLAKIPAQEWDEEGPSHSAVYSGKRKELGTYSGAICMYIKCLSYINYYIWESESSPTCPQWFYSSVQMWGW